MVRTIIEDSRPEGISLADLGDGCGFIYDDSFYIKTENIDETCGSRILCVNVQTWEIVPVFDDEWVIPCKMEMRVMPGEEV